MAELFISTGGIALSLTTVGEALGIALVVAAIGLTLTVMIYTLLQHAENDIRIELQSQDIVSLLR